MTHARFAGLFAAVTATVLLGAIPAHATEKVRMPIIYKVQASLRGADKTAQLAEKALAEVEALGMPASAARKLRLGCLADLRLRPKPTKAAPL